MPRLRGKLWAKLKHYKLTLAHSPTCQKKSTQWALTREEMKNCIWLELDLVAQIEFTEWTPDCHLRHSKILRVSRGQGARDVVRRVATQPCPCIPIYNDAIACYLQWPASNPFAGGANSQRLAKFSRDRIAYFASNVKIYIDAVHWQCYALLGIFCHIW